MIDPEKYLDRAEKEYLLDGRTQFVFRLRHTKDTRADYRQLEAELKKYPWVRVTRYRDEKDGYVKVGRACEITILLEDLLKRRPSVKNVRAAFQEALRRAVTVDLKGFLGRQFSECKKKAESLPAVVATLEYLLANRSKIEGLYPRQIPHGQSTKILGHEPLLLRLYEHHLSATSCGKRSVRWEDFVGDFNLRRKPAVFQFFAGRIRWDGIELKDVHSIVTEENAQRWGLEDIENILVVENEESFYPLMGRLDGFLILLGAGFQISGAQFLRGRLKANVYYWGDIDREGYEIFGVAEKIFPGARPICMWASTIRRRADLCQKVPVSEPGETRIPLLDDEYRFVCRRGIQIEQEQLDLSDVLAAIRTPLKQALPAGQAENSTF